MTKADFQAFLDSSTHGGGGSQGSRMDRPADNSGDRTGVGIKQDSEQYTTAASRQGVGSNPRNTAAGALRNQNPAQTASTRLSFLAYQLLCPPVPTSLSGSAYGDNSVPRQQQRQQPVYLLRSQYESLQCLKAAGFAVSEDVAR